MKSVALIVGGSSGLGLELARLFSVDHRVIITGRQDPEDSSVEFHPIDLDTFMLQSDIAQLLSSLPEIHTLVYAAGYFRDGTIDELDEEDIECMSQVGLLAPAFMLHHLVRKQKKLPGFIAITSTSQWVPREREPMYTAVKAGLGMLASSVSLDARVGKVLVAAPSGMNTRFWNATERDTSDMLDPAWVARETMDVWSGSYKYKLVRILRNPLRVESVEAR